jgi:HlyD family secretion protein
MGRRSPGRSPWLVVAVLAATLLASCQERVDVGTARAQTAGADRESLVALARLEPSSQVVNLGSVEGGVIDQLLVAEGDEVTAGQVVAQLRRHSLRAAELEAARLQLERAGLQPFEVDAQRARMRASQAELSYAREEVESQKGLSAKGFSAGKEFRDAQLRVMRAEEQLNESRAVLARMEASAGLDQRDAQNKVLQAEERLEQTLVRSPIDGRVLRVRVKEGERWGGTSLLSVGATQNMTAVAEVHANEIRLVERGQAARFTSPALASPLQGRVDSVGEMIFGNNITGEDPSAPRGLRVVQVRVLLEENALAERLTNLEGQLRIYLDGTSPPDLAGTDGTASR